MRELLQDFVRHGCEIKLTLIKAHDHYQMCGPGKAARGSKEKMVYLRERKALKTIGIVVLGE